MPQSKFKELQETAKKEILKLHPAGIYIGRSDGTKSPEICIKDSECQQEQICNNNKFITS